MSKYDFEIDLSENSSTGIILGNIRKGSVVLEFGCATGRMTRYMKEALSCQVYIVEYEQAAYDVALQYAEDGLCDDIMTFRWAEKFRDIRFDAIIFADVLEHLSAPEKVLERAAELLKDDGCLYVSIPNITHNDILLKAYEEHFDYTATGILDDTHVHFWGAENIGALADGSGLNIRSVTGTFCPTGYTEQFVPPRAHDNILLENILLERKCGEVYQFVVVFDKGESSEAAVRFPKLVIHSHIYLDTGNGFNAEEILAFESNYSRSGTYTAHYEITDTKNLSRIRFDPIEYQGCILRNVSIRQGEEALQPIYPNGIEMANGILLCGTDPMLYADVTAEAAPITIDAEIVVLGQTYIDILQNAYESLQDAHTVLKSAYSDKCAEYQREISRLNAVRRELQSRIYDLTGETKLLRNSIAALNGEVEELRRDLGAYIILTNNKEKYILELERERDYYKNLKIIKLRTFILRAARGIIRRIKRVIGKEAC